MVSSYASNAILSKARARYGKRLTAKNYSDLLGCNDVREVAIYLKKYTNYSDVLADLNENDVHRGHLEVLLKKKIFNDFAILGRYEISIHEGLSVYLISRMEIEQIMHCLMLYCAHRTNEYIYTVPMFFNNHTHIDLPALTKIKNYDDFLQAIKLTPYYKLLKPFQPKGNELISLTMIETVLYSYLFHNTFKIVEQYKNKKTRKELKNIFNAYIDFNNLVRIIRLKKYYNPDEDYIRDSLFPYGTISNKKLESLIQAKSIDEIHSIVQTTTFGKLISGIEYDYIDELPTKVKFAKCKHFIRYSVNPPVVMLSYILLTELELSNIINIIEGIRYKLPKDEIKKMLNYEQ